MNAVASYNVERMARKHSVILTEWRSKHGPSVVKAREQARIQQRLYAGAGANRLNADWNPINTSADSELITSLRVLRARSRELVRDNEYAKNAVRIIKNNVIGTGIGMQPTVSTAGGKLVERINAEIAETWTAWCDKDSCHTAGKLHFSDVERLAVGLLVTDGEVLLRKVRQPFGRDNRIPFALEIIEADRLIDFWTSTTNPENGNSIRMGVEHDPWMRPVAYWFHPNHPGDYQFSTFVASRFIRVPADEIIHLHLVDRWPQTRGEPWFHAVIKRLNNMGGYEEAEIVAARAAASVMGIIESPDLPLSDDVQAGQRVTDLQPGTIQHLLPGEKFTGFDPSRPNANLDPFMRYMLRAVAAAIGCSYESLSRDYSQSNYSSSRLALLDDRDLWRVLQGWMAVNFRAEIHREWMAAAVMANALPSIRDYYSNKGKYQKVRFKPRGWSWIDPAKEVQAFKTAVRCGFMTVSDVIGQTHADAEPEDVFCGRRT